MTVQELIEKIFKWENEAGESFFDYFAHDQVNNVSWAFWLLGKGFTEHANKIIDIHLKDNGYVDQEDLYVIFPEYDYVNRSEYGDPNYSQENYEKNVALMAEFLLATPQYTNKINKWFAEQNS